MVDTELDRVLPAEGAGFVEDHLHVRVVVCAVEVEVDPADVVLPVGRPSGQGAGLLAHVALGVAVPGPEGEDLHHLAGVVLVRGALDRVQPIEVEKHRRVDRHPHREPGEVAEPALPEEVVLREHQLLVPDRLVRGREPVVPDERHPLDERPRGANHLVEPPADGRGRPRRTVRAARRRRPGSARRACPGSAG